MIKKLDINEVLKYEIAGEMSSVFVSKINQIIDYLKAKEEASLTPVGCCCTKKHSTGEASKGEIKQTYFPSCGHDECNCPMEDHGKIDPPESKGECKHCHMSLSVRNPSGYCDHLKYPSYCDHCNTTADIFAPRNPNPPEHEEENQPQPDSKVEMVRMDLVNKHYVSKEKIKRAFTKILGHSIGCVAFNDKKTCNNCKLTKSLGLGD